LNILFFQVGLRRIAQGKWGNNNGQACIAPDYILVDESIASELVCDSSTDALKDIIEKFYGKDPKLSKDLSRIVNASHYSRLTKLLDDPRISSKIVHGGERDENKL
jgi:aldehyde dehydrogenase (NAD+)